MTQSPNGPISRSALDRYFQVCLYLLIVTGFVTLASTGKLDAPALVLVSTALVYRGYLLARGCTVQVPERWTSYLTMAYVAFYACDLFLLSGNFVSATVHLVLFVMVVKIFSVQRDRDHLYLAVISFLSVLAAAVLTVDAVFFASFCIFLLLASATFVSMEMRRAATQAGKRLCAPPHRGLSGSLSTTALALTLGTALGSVSIFFILPRLSTGYLSAYAPSNTLAAGFSDEVRLGDIGHIQQSDSVVMHIQIDGDTRGEHDLKWRGVALKTFDGTRWSNPQPQATALSSADGTFDLSATRAATGATASQHLVRYRVLMEPIGSNLFFLAPRPKTLSCAYHAIAVDDSGAVFNNDPDQRIGAYHAVSNTAQPLPGELRHTSGEVPTQVAIHYLQLPSVDPRVPQLATEITAGANTAYDKAVALEGYLQTHYGYTLQLPSTPQRDPLAYFLFERKAGHCEFFASSMAIMLRTVGIPSRVVNGFRGGEFNSLTGSYIVRARDAHSWVEAYFPRYGWVTFDPTPAGGAPIALGRWNRARLYIDALHEFWREWVVNYDFAHQMNLTNSLATRSRRTFESTRAWIRNRYARLLDNARRVKTQVEASPHQYGGIALVVVATVVVVLNLGRLRRALQVRRLVRNPASAPQAAASVWYERMLRSLARRGWRKAPVHTPKEFVRTIDDPKLRGPVTAFTDHYERARFGDSADDARTLPEIYEEIRKA